MTAARRRPIAPPPSYPTPRIYGAILALRRGGERVENYCRDRRLHVIGNAILDEDTLLARAAEVGYAARRAAA